MNKTLTWLLNALIARWPRLLPQTDFELDSFIRLVLGLAGLPENASFRHAVATQIMHLPPDATKAAPIVFIKAIKRSIANQAAYNLIIALKEEAKCVQKETKEPS